MGLTLSFLRLLARAHAVRPINGPVLTLGRQAIYATFDEVQNLWRSEGISPHTLDPAEDLLTNIPSWKTGPNSSYTNDNAVFKSLAGLEVFALDNSDYESPDYRANLNFPVPRELDGKFGLIIDAGTLEHVFDINQGLRNVNCMLKIGGRIIHSSPATNWLQHGFYQFSPTLFYDYYGTNRFINLKCYILEVRKRNLRNSYKNRCDCWEWNVERPYSPMISDETLVVYFEAEKTDASTTTEIPEQGQYAGHAEGGRMGVVPKSEAILFPLAKIRKYIPLSIKNAIKRALGYDIMVKPWGLKYVGKV